MARPCGCTGGVVATGGEGICTSGTGSVDSPLNIAMCDPITGAACAAVVNCVGRSLGNGMSYNGSSIGTRLTPSGGLTFDPNGAMMLSGTVPTPGQGAMTVPSLEQRGKNVVVGATGAGFMIKPEGLIKSYEYGLNIGVDMMTVLIRYLIDGTPVVYTDEFLGRTMGEAQFNNPAYWATQAVVAQTPHRWQYMISEPGVWNPRQAWQPPGQLDPIGFQAPPGTWAQLLNGWNDNASNMWSQSVNAARSPSYGWFGFMEPNQYGLTFLGDLLRVVGGHIPLVLELRFPSNVQDPNAEGPWRTDNYLARVLAMIVNGGLQNYVVVITNTPTIPGNPSGTTNVLDRFSAAGIRVGLRLNSPTDVATYPAASFAAKGWTWAQCGVSIADADIQSYVTHGIHTLMAYVNRQYMWNRVTANNVLGAVSGDPFYAASMAGLPATHPLSQPTYRVGTSNWMQLGVDHGLFPQQDDANHVVSTLRGHPQVSVNRHYHEPQQRLQGADVGLGYYVLQGWACPLPTPTNISFDWIWSFDSFAPQVTDDETLLMAFGVPTDHDFADWPTASPPDPNVRSRDTGYTLWMTQTGKLYLFEYAQGAGQNLATVPITGGLATGDQIHLLLGINAKGIRVQYQKNGGAWTQAFSITTPPATLHRGPYFYLGRLSFYQNNNPQWQGWYGWTDTMWIKYNGGTNNGPQ